MWWVQRRPRGRSAALWATVCVVVTVLLTGCGAMPSLTVEQLPLPAPGGVGDGITVTARFDNALNLPDKAKVKLGGTDVGEVTSIRAQDYSAIVTMRVKRSARVAVGTGAQLRQATPLGDVFVALTAPARTTGAVMSDGDMITGPTGAAATVEDILVSATAIVDGGALTQLQQIVQELSLAVGGHGDEIRGVVDGLTTAIRRLNDNSVEVDHSLDQLAGLTGDLAAGRQKITAGIRALGPALDTVTNQTSSILSTFDTVRSVTGAVDDFVATSRDQAVQFVANLNRFATALDESTAYFVPLATKLHTLTPQWVNSMRSSAAALSAKLYYLTTGFGADDGARLPGLDDLRAGADSLEETLQRVIARLTGTRGCCR
ncbi:MCE family protein [Gordonia jinhuaensis]|uniref:MCE family protein n=1 Tax=Gordonia jinhuaensis TaxID=1517702 RepID=UPI00166AB853